MNYFEWFDLKKSFLIDAKELKRVFLIKAKELHPDFHTMKTEEEQAEILQQSTYNNDAFKILSNDFKRCNYLLNLEGDNLDALRLPQSFLVEMMDINEAIMELEFDFDQSILEKQEANVKTLLKEYKDAEKKLFEAYEITEHKQQVLIQVKEISLKKRYLLRIIESLDKFADQS